MATYSADDIVGKSLIAKRAINVYRGNDLTQSVYTIKPGQTVGTVVSYLMPNDSREVLYWMFNDANGRAYYTKQVAGNYDIKTIKEQGVLTLDEKKKKEEAADQTTGDKLLSLLQKGFIGAGLFYLAATAIKSSNDKN